MPELLVKPFFGQMANDYPDNHFMTISPGAIGGKDEKGTRSTSKGFLRGIF